MKIVGFILIVYLTSLTRRGSLYGRLNLLERTVVYGNKKILRLLDIDKGEEDGTAE
tara:strand:+ start:75 stop:242 length:168 start_codon:yes stop_codon:yes gene_type:complete